MIQLLFLVLWTALFLLIARISWMKIRRHIKVYLLLIYDWLYLTGIFLIFPNLKDVLGALL